MRLIIALILSAATAYTPPRPPRRSPRSPGGNNKPPSRKREIIVEPLESWGAFDTGKHRMGVSTVSWGNPDNGFVRKKKLRGGERFSQKDCRLAYQELMQNYIKTFAIPGGQASVDCFGKAVKKAKVFDPPKVVTYCAPSLKARYFGKEDNRKRYGYASVATSVNDVLEVLGSAYVDACLVGGALPGSSCPSPPRASNSIESVGVQNVQGGGALRKAHRAFERKGLQLKACYVDFSLVDNLAMRDGTLEAAKELDITVLARSPLCAGLGSGEITERNPTGGSTVGASPKWRPRALRQLAPLHDAIEQVCGMVQARRADDERSMAQRQNRDAGKVRACVEIKRPSSRCGRRPKFDFHAGRQNPTGTSRPPMGPRQRSGTFTCGQKPEARPGDHRVPGLGARGKRGRGARRRAAEVGAKVRAAALSLLYYSFAAMAWGSIDAPGWHDCPVQLEAADVHASLAEMAYLK